MTARLIAAVALILIVSAAQSATVSGFSLVINNGRVIDPETGLDAIRHIGIEAGSITHISTTPLQGDQILDATGMVVSPGFIDLHTHSPTPLGQYYQLFDGVTTALELEAGSFPVSSYGSGIADQALINFGASAGYISIRLLHKNGIAAGDATADPKPASLKGWLTAAKFLFMDFDSALRETFAEPASEADRLAMATLLHNGLDEGALGIGLPLDYISEAVDAKELGTVFEVAAQRGAPIFVHVRRGVNGDPRGLTEVITLAERTGASVHICHISHNAMKNIELFLDEINSARARGIDISTEVLPYNAGSALISSAVFGRDWQKIFDITYGNVEWAATGERLTQETFARYREEEPQGGVIHHYLRDEWTQRALREPGVIVVSDLLPMKSVDTFVAPHNGAFTRVLGHYSRDENLLSLNEALKKMTLLPAQRMEKYVPAFRKKGRIQIGMDADITVFNADTVKDRATYRNPYQEATGLAHIVVNGRIVVHDAKLVPDTFPGQRVLGPVAHHP